MLSAESFRLERHQLSAEKVSPLFRCFLFRSFCSNLRRVISTDIQRSHSLSTNFPLPKDTDQCTQLFRSDICSCVEKLWRNNLWTSPNKLFGESQQMLKARAASQECCNSLTNTTKGVDAPCSGMEEAWENSPPESHFRSVFFLKTREARKCVGNFFCPKNTFVDVCFKCEAHLNVTAHLFQERHLWWDTSYLPSPKPKSRREFFCGRIHFQCRDPWTRWRSFSWFLLELLRKMKLCTRCTLFSGRLKCIVEGRCHASNNLNTNSGK